MQIRNLDSLFHEQLRDLYSAEDQILQALPQMIGRARDSELRDALQSHMEETRTQKKRLEEIGRLRQLEVGGHTCKGMAGILKEGQELVGEDVDGDGVIDAAIVAAAQRVEHYEMAGYGTARTFARMLGDDDSARRLQENLDEEKHADRRLTQIAEDHVNRKASASH